jgi:hypothetical protein
MTLRPLLFIAIQLILIALKLTAVIDWSWWYIMVPTLALVALIIWLWIVLMVYKSMGL